MRCRSASAVVALLAIAPLTLAAAAEMPPGASSCSGCHAGSGVETPVPRLAGRPAADIVAAMQQFRAGQRPASVMDRIAKGFTDTESAAIAAWYAAQ